MIYALFKAKITNPDSLAKYREKAGAALAVHGGKVETGTQDATALDGHPDMPDLAALLSFPDKAAALAWINDPDLTDLHELRRGAGETEILLLG